MSTEKKSLIVHFYMQGGHVITVDNVESIDIDFAFDGLYKGYSLTWIDPEKAPKHFSLNIPSIVAIIARDAE